MLVVDTHVHLYGCHDFALSFANAFRHLDAWGGPGAERALCLTERAGDFFFRRLREGSLAAEGYAIAAGGDGVLEVRDGAGRVLRVAPGRQIVTAERLEVLALLVDLDLADGAPAAEVLAAVRDAGGVPVLPWSPGKWFGARGRVVAHLLASGAPGSFLLGDSTQRPRGWGEPRLFREALARGFAVVAGSDPLPLRGEERFVGSYASAVDAALDPARPLASLRALLGDARTPWTRAGRRPGLLTAVRRQWRLRRGR